MRFGLRWIAALVALLCLVSPGFGDQNDTRAIDPSSPPDSALISYIQRQQASLTQPGEALSDFSKPGSFHASYNDGQNSTITIVPAEGQPFAQAIHVVIHQRQNPAYRVQILTHFNTRPVRKGDVLFVSYYARTLAAQDETGQALIRTLLQLNGPPWTNTFVTNTRLTRQWSPVYATATATQDFAPGTLGLCIHAGFYPQTFELGGIYVLNLGPNADVSKLPFTRISYTGRELDAPWRKEAAERIEKYRKGNLTVNVVDAAGKPVPDARVSVAMQRHAYNFGTYFDKLDMVAKPETDPDNAARYRQFVKDHFNLATIPIYWGWIWNSPENMEKHRLLAAWLKENNFRIKAHCMIWPGFRWLPKKAEELKNDPVALRQYCLDHIKQTAQFTKDQGYQQVDVMNEPRGNHDLMDILGQDVMVDWFKTVREINPDIQLFINEYSILTAGGTDADAQDAYAKTIEYLIAHHAPLDGIGMQSHFGSDLTAPPRVLAILDRFAKYGKELASTEFDINIEDPIAQADYTRDFMTVFFSHPATTTFIMWGFWEKTHWMPSGAMMRKDWTPKPNLQAYQDLVYKQWWTNTAGTTSPGGQYQTRGFLGDYLVTVERAGRKVQLPAKLVREGTTVSITLK